MMTLREGASLALVFLGRAIFVSIGVIMISSLRHRDFIAIPLS